MKMVRVFLEILIQLLCGIQKLLNKDADAQTNLGTMYYHGKGVLQDFEKLFTGIEKLRNKGMHMHKII